ncbi:MAG TPA: hypothetical protein VJS64_17360 [Pyrinomonadaceae bacterium]|nr:hypothetical protein [Pyrinomonadaceae bacterium]
MEISPSLFDLEESGKVSAEGIKRQVYEILKNYDESVRRLRGNITDVGRPTVEKQGVTEIKEISSNRFPRSGREDSEKGQV